VVWRAVRALSFSPLIDPPLEETRRRKESGSVCRNDTTTLDEVTIEPDEEPPVETVPVTMA
jgi:hypothetical protein